jgi:peptidylprolyl isomerase
MVTLYIENDDKSKTPAGWSTRVSDGASEDKPFEFQPGVGLIEGWTAGVLQMKEGERALLHVPAHLGYGSRAMGSPGGSGFYIPGSSNLLFDIEIIGKSGGEPDL